MNLLQECVADKLLFLLSLGLLWGEREREREREGKGEGEEGKEGSGRGRGEGESESKVMYSNSKFHRTTWKC